MELTVQAVEEAIAEHLAPILALDGGVVQMRGLDENSGHLRLALMGSYRGCPSRQVVFDLVVVPTLKQKIPELKEIELV